MDTKTSSFSASTRHFSAERRKYLLKPVLLWLIGPGLLYGLVLTVLWILGKIPVLGFILGLSVQVFCLLALWMHKLGKTRSAAYLIVLALFLIIYGGSYYFGVGHALLIGYAVVALVAGILIDVMAALFFALVSMAAYMLVSLAQQGGVIQAISSSSQNPIAPNTIGLSIALIALIIFLWLYERQMVRIISRDRELNAEIEKANSLLKIELQEKTRAQNAIKRKLNFQETITSISSRFVGSSGLDAAITSSLHDIVLLCGANQAYLNFFQDNKKTYRKSHEWKTDENLGNIDNLEPIIIETITKWMENLFQNRVIYFKDLTYFLENNQSQAQVLDEKGIDSFLILPLKTSGELTGFIILLNVVKAKEWETEDFKVLRVFSEIMSNAFDRKNLEDQLLQSQKMEAIGRLAGGIAHDFNNILTAIIGHSQLALMTLKPGDSVYQDIKDISKAGERASSLTYQLLAFSRRQMLQLENLDLNSLIKSMQKMLRRLIGEDIEIATVLDPQLGNIKADRIQIEQVIMNLIVNARDALDKGGKIIIATKNLEGDHLALTEDGANYVMLSVSDNGCGMDKETQSHIFEPFFTTKETDKGTGLGLSTVYGIIKQSNGKISVYSEPEQGTTFKIYLPALGEKLVAKIAQQTAQKPMKGTETILAVEDNNLVRELISKSLKHYKYLVLKADHPDEAIKICSSYKGHIHLMVTDIVMPKMSGKELVEQVSPLRPDMKILYTSGFTDSAIVHHGILDSDIAFLQKPFTPDELARKIREILDTH